MTDPGPHRRLPRSATTVFLIMLAALNGRALAGDSLSSQEREMLTTRTAAPQLSAEMVRALELDVTPWHKPGVKLVPVRIGDDAIRQSTLVALQALESLPAQVPQNDFDRAWLVYEKADALKFLGRAEEARAAFQVLRKMPRSEIQDRAALAGLYSLGDEQSPGWWEPGRLVPAAGSSQQAYPAVASRRGIEGWLDVVADVQPDGSIGHIAIRSSSPRIFERPTAEWLSTQQYRLTANGRPPGCPCFARSRMSFKMSDATQTRFSIDEIGSDAGFSYASVGAAIRVRAAAREAALMRPASAPGSMPASAE